MKSEMIPDHTGKLVDYFLEDLARQYQVPTGLYIQGEETNFPLESKKHFSPLCSYFAKNKKLKRFCDEDHAHRGINATHPIVRMCHCGLFNFSYPIFLNEKHVGTILCGQKTINDEQQSKESRKKFNDFLDANKGIINKNKALEKYKYVDNVNSSFFEDIKDDISKIAALIIKVFFERREIEHEREIVQKNISFISHEILIHNQGASAAATELIYKVKHRDFEQIYNIAKHIEGSLQHITTVVTNLVWAETKMSYDFQTVNLIELAKTSIAHYNWFASGRDINIVLDIGEGSPKIVCSKNHIFQLINNLLHNAIKYSFKGNKSEDRNRFVQVNLHKRTDINCYCIEFTNYGIGILEEEYNKILKYQYRGSLVSSENRSGTGLGLRIVNRIVAKHNGKIVVNSKKLHEGAYLNFFKIYLPIDMFSGGFYEENTLD